jgi:molybdopterin-containing oxidoreductase family membrane subunit
MVFGAVLSPSPFSPMWWMGVFYGAYLVFLAVEVISMFTSHYTVHRAACVASSITAIFAPLTLGAVFAVVAAHPFWHGAITPPYMILSAFVAGTALLGIAFYCVHRFRLVDYERAASVAIPSLRLLLVVGVGATLALVALKMAGLGPGAGLAEAVPCWRTAGTVLTFRDLGLVSRCPPRPARTRTRRPLRGLVPAFVGLFADRAIFVHAGQIAPTTAAAGTVSVPFAEYTPTLVELSIVVGAFAFVALAYTLAERFLDMSPHLGHGTPVEIEVTAWVPVPTEGVL